jgi:hypothetical protein
MTLYERPRLQVLIGDRDVTERCDQIVFSATDAGGYEICTLGLPAADRPKKGQSITIRQGLEVAWMGRVAEIGDHSQHTHATRSIGGEGLVALLRDSPYSMIYVDRDLSRWGPPSTARQITLVNANQPLSGTTQASPDPGSNLPALAQTITDSWVSPNIPVAEAMYDAGPGNLIAYVYYNLVQSANIFGVANWHEELRISSDDIQTFVVSTSNLNGSSTPGYLAAPPLRYAMAEHYYGVTNQGAQGSLYGAWWRNLAVYGNHGLGGRLPDPVGFYPSDIARHALSQCAGVTAGTIVDATGYIAPHVVYRTPTPADTIVDDMAKLMGWTWGVWEPATVLGSQPRLDFRPPPTDATCTVAKAECDQLDITSRLGDLYTTAIVSFTDAGGSAGEAIVTLPNPALAEAGIAGRTLLLNLGVAGGTPTQPPQVAAAAFGTFALQLSQVAARAAGQATLPVNVRLPGGGSKPACLIRPGIDRIRITDLIDGGPLLDLGTTRRDVFRVSRVETTVAQDGSLSTRVELDSGQDILAVLQARLALSTGIVGGGATG